MRIELSMFIALLLGASAIAQEKTISFPSGVSFETGDSWAYEGREFRLFGVQSCIRGTIYRSPDGQEEDCGLRSVASLAALFSTGSIGCQPIAQAKDDATIVVCAAEIGGSMVDVGTALISSGVAFAAAFPSGVPVSSAYAVAELTAKESGSGLWKGDFDHPVTRLLDRR